MIHENGMEIGMNEGIQIYKCDSTTIYQRDFYNMTRLNFMYDRRRLYNKKQDQLEYNSYFPMDFVKERIAFYCLYLSAYTFMDFSDIDFDFDIGFNNMEYNIEERMINMLKEEFSEIKIMVKIFNSYENSDIIKRIEETYNILFSGKSIWNFYIIELDDIEDINFLYENICGILLGEKDFSLSFDKKEFDFIDLKSIQMLIEEFSLIILRVPIFSNYNVMLYAKKEETIDTINKRILEWNSDEFDIESIPDIKDPKNFLFVE